MYDKLWKLVGFRAEGWEGLEFQDMVPVCRRWLLFGLNGAGKSSFTRLLSLVEDITKLVPWHDPGESWGSRVPRFPRKRDSKATPDEEILPATPFWTSTTAETFAICLEYWSDEFKSTCHLTLKYQRFEKEYRIVGVDAELTGARADCSISLQQPEGVKSWHANIPVSYPDQLLLPVIMGEPILAEKRNLWYSRAAFSSYYGCESNSDWHKITLPSIVSGFDDKLRSSLHSLLVKQQPGISSVATVTAWIPDIGLIPTPEQATEKTLYDARKAALREYASKNLISLRVKRLPLPKDPLFRLSCALFPIPIPAPMPIRYGEEWLGRTPYCLQSRLVASPHGDSDAILLNESVFDPCHIIRELDGDLDHSESFMDTFGRRTLGTNPPTSTMVPESDSQRKGDRWPDEEMWHDPSRPDEEKYKKYTEDLVGQFVEIPGDPNHPITTMPVKHLLNFRIGALDKTESPEDQVRSYLSKLSGVEETLQEIRRRRHADPSYDFRLDQCLLGAPADKKHLVIHQEQRVRICTILNLKEAGLYGGKSSYVGMNGRPEDWEDWEEDWPQPLWARMADLFSVFLHSTFCKTLDAHVFQYLGTHTLAPSMEEAMAAYLQRFGLEDQDEDRFVDENYHIHYTFADALSEVRANTPDEGILSGSHIVEDAAWSRLAAQLELEGDKVDCELGRFLLTESTIVYYLRDLLYFRYWPGFELMDKMIGVLPLICSPTVAFHPRRKHSTPPNWDELVDEKLLRSYGDLQIPPYRSVLDQDDAGQPIFKFRDTESGRLYLKEEIGKGFFWQLGLLLQADQGETYYEHPEHFLHPRAAADVAEEIMATTERSVLETHSEAILLRTQSLIRQGMLKADGVTLLVFQRCRPDDQSPARCHITRISFADDGALRQSLPDGFAEVYLDEWVDDDE